MLISAVILAKNEEKNISQAIKSLDFVDEILVGDDNSNDKTEEIAKKNGAKVIKLELILDFSAKRNQLIKNAKGDWLLFIDADEEISKELKTEIISLLKQPKYAAYYLKRRDFFWGREMKYGEIKKVRKQGIIRLLKKNSGHWQGKVHEVFLTNLPVGKLNFSINHYPHPTITAFLKKINYYSTLRAQELADKGIKTNILEIIFFPFGKFILNYFFYLGFLDGPAGFVYAFMMSFHSFLVRGKLSEIYSGRYVN